MILTDHEFKILHLLRFFSPEDEDVKIRTGEIYPIEKSISKTPRITPTPTLVEFTELLENEKNNNILKVLNPRLDLGANAIEHVLFDTGFKNPRAIKCSDLISESENVFKQFENLKLDGSNIQACITQTENKSKDIDGNEVITKQYLDFYSHEFSFLSEKSSNKTIFKFDSFQQATDDFFSFAKQYKDNQASRNVEKQATKKLENARKNHARQIERFQNDQSENRIKAELIEQNVELVEKALLIVNSMMANKLDWAEIEQLLKEAKSKNDPVAMAIKSLKLEQNKITMLLVSKDDEEDDFESDDSLGLSSDSEDESNKKPVKKEKISKKVDIDLALSAYSNISSLHTNKKTAARKEEKTHDAGEKVLKSAQIKAKTLIQEAEKIKQIRKSRKVYWFEKYLWFITSENYLCIAGRDAIQNEQIVKRYLKPGDAYIHADIHGAASVVLKNHSKTKKLPPKSLEEAGNFALINSSAWDAKIVSGIYWVESHQVSKTAQSGEYLSTGSFMIRGKKNFLPGSAQNLTIGYGFLFKLEEDSLERHKNERCVHESVVLENLEGVEVDDVKEDAESDIDLSADEKGKNDDKNDNVDEDNDNDENIDENKEEEPILEVKPENPAENDKNDFEFPETSLTAPEITSKPSRKHKKSQNNIDSEDEEYAPVGKPNIQKTRALPAWKQEKLDAKKNNQQIRGKKGKNKKMKKKYGDQDEEEKAEIMKMLQSEGAKSGKRTKGRRSNKHAGGSSQPSVEKVIKQKLEKAEKLEKIEEAKESEKFRKKPSASDKSSNKPKPPQVNIPESDVKIDFSELSELTSQPYADDTLLFGLPMVAPYSTMQKFKFKVKMTPGTNKKGKTAKTVLEGFLRDKATTQLEKDLLKAITHDDLFKNLPGKVKLVNTGKK